MHSSIIREKFIELKKDFNKNVINKWRIMLLKIVLLAMLKHVLRIFVKIIQNAESAKLKCFQNDTKIKKDKVLQQRRN